MSKYTFTAAEQATPEFICRGDMGSKASARFKILHPEIDGNTLQVQQKCSDSEWWTTTEISAEMASIIDTPVECLIRIKCSTFGGAPFSIIYQE